MRTQGVFTNATEKMLKVTKRNRKPLKGTPNPLKRTQKRDQAYWAQGYSRVLKSGQGN